MTAEDLWDEYTPEVFLVPGFLGRTEQHRVCVVLAQDRWAELSSMRLLFWRRILAPNYKTSSKCLFRIPGWKKTPLLLRTTGPSKAPKGFFGACWRSLRRSKHHKVRCSSRGSLGRLDHHRVLGACLGSLIRTEHHGVLVACLGSLGQTKTKWCLVLA